MFKDIFKYELFKLSKQAATYFYIIVFFAMAFLSMLGTGGYFDGVPEIDENLQLLNAPHQINFIFQYFNKFFLFLLPAIIGLVIYKDFKYHVYPILYSFPIRKSDYLLGKFLSALLIVFVITLSIGFAFYLGELVLGKDHPMIGPTNFWAYLRTYIFFVFPNMFMYGLLVFAVVGSLRNIYAGFIAIIILFFLQIILENLFSGNSFLMALFDPFGQNAAGYETRYWTQSEKSIKQIPVLGIVLWNRLFWTAICSIIFSLFYNKFQLEQETFELLPKKIKKEKKKALSNNENFQRARQRTNVNCGFSTGQQFKAMLQLSVINLRYIIKSWLFFFLVLHGIFAIVFALGKVTNSGDMTFLPLTRIILSVPMFFFSTVIILLTFVYAGKLVHRSKMAKANQLVDTTAISNWVLLGSKILALLQVQILLLFVMMACGIGLQIFNGYYHFEIGLYLFHLFILTFPILIIWAVISVFTHTILPNVYLGIFLLLLLWMGKDQVSKLGIESHLAMFNSPPQILYSDLNGYGNGLYANYLINAYWLAFSGFVLIIGYLFWRRGFTYSGKERIEIAAQRLKGPVPYFAFLSLLLFFIVGFTIYQKENGPHQKTGNEKNILENFRANFEKYKSCIQPKITTIQLNIELFPESNSFRANGEYLLVNNSLKNIDTLLIKTGYDEISDYSISVPSNLFSKDKNMQFAIHLLEKPLLPNDSLRLHFNIKNKHNTIFNQNSTVLKNGTFLRADILPRLGYFLDKEPRHPSDSLAKYLNFYSGDADLIDIETVISTSPEQTAIAPGYLENQWTENGRNYFHYKTKGKIKFAFAFNSGIFSTKETTYKGTDLKIYYHKNHSHNLEDMLEGLKAALDYNTRYFAPYQHREVRVVEFPLSEGTYASVMSNSIPTSEARFILNNKIASNRVNLSFYVQAHELTHQWWGNQLVPANALGAKMLTESITEYISLRIYEKYFGREKAQHFLSLQRQRYLQGRTRETGIENPLYLVHPDQEYIAYGKGAMALNALQHHVGEEKLNGLLRTFLEQYRFRTDRYPTSIDLIAHLKKYIAAEFHYIINDMMETTTFFDIKINDVQTLSGDDLEVTIDLKKLDAATNQELNTGKIFLEIGQYDDEERCLFMDKFSVSSGTNKVIISRKLNMKFILLDPQLHFIEYDLKNNKKTFTPHLH